MTSLESNTTLKIMEASVFEPCCICFEHSLLRTCCGFAIKVWCDWSYFYLVLKSWVLVLGLNVARLFHKKDSINRFHGSSAVNLSWFGLVLIYQMVICRARGGIDLLKTQSVWETKGSRPSCSLIYIGETWQIQSVLHEQTGTGLSTSWHNS